MAKKVALTKRDREKIRKILLARRAELLSDMDGTEHEIDELQEPKADDLDRAVEAGAMELLVALGDTERRELEEVTLSLEKLDAETYGKCEACEQIPAQSLNPTCPFIPKLRLEALPTARLCVACQEAEERNQIPSYTRLRPRRMFGEDVEEFSHPLMDSDDDK
jgi:DnaK suppressor protein